MVDHHNYNQIETAIMSDPTKRRFIGDGNKKGSYFSSHKAENEK
jgi:hypothetical protein